MDALEKWLEGRPKIIKETARKYPPRNYYELKDTGQRGHVIGYSEDGTVRVFICGHKRQGLEQVYSLVPLEVFGINPEDLEEVK